VQMRQRTDVIGHQGTADTFWFLSSYYKKVYDALV
jgi:hypothetical protein